jgi:exosome complex RNA-binding protein Rrp42 (RNase PH superfamily)
LVRLLMGLIRDKVVVDPLPAEEEVADTIVTLGYSSETVVAAIQKSAPGYYLFRCFARWLN